MSGEHHSQYWDYVSKFIPPQNLALLDVVLDDGDDGERDLLEIAQYISKWEEKLVGPLRLTREEVDTVNEVSNPELKRRNVLRVWKDKEGLRATYGCLLDRCLQGKDSRTAQKICEILKQKSSSGHDKSSRDDDDDDVSVTLVKRNLAKIKGSFATLVTKVTTSLMTKNIDMNVFRLYIITLFPPGDILSRASSVAEVCEAISHHQLWDFSSYSPVEEIVKNFGADDPELSGWIKEYKSELAGFKAVTKIAHYIEACSDDEDMADSEQSLQQHIARYDKRYCCKLSFKLKPARVTEKSLDYIDALWRSIADYFYLPSLSVLLETIKEGCVEVTWLVPTLSALQVETNIQDSGEFLKKMEIMQVTMDSIIVYIDEEEVEVVLKKVKVLCGKEKRLLEACERGQVDEVMDILACKVNVDTADSEDGDTPLSIAALAGNYELAELLLKHHACVDKEIKDGYTPLMLAVEAVADHFMIKLLLEHNADVNRISEDGWTALKLACKRGSLDTVKLLIQKGANIDAWSKVSGTFRWTPLVFAANEGHLEICQLLLHHGARVDMSYITPLILASKRGNLKVVELLLKHGAKVDTQREDGTTAIFWACQEGHLEVVEVLHAHGASVDIPSKRGVTPLISASTAGHLYIVKFLLQMKAEVNTQSKTGWTPLMCASCCNHPAVVAELLAHGADTELATAQSGLTPLIVAAKEGHVQIVELLLEAKAQVDYREKATGWSALMITASRGHVTILQILIRYGANVSLKAKDSEVTAYDIASIDGQVEVCEELQKHGYQSLAPPTAHMKQEVEQSNSILTKNFLDTDNIRLFRHVLSQGGGDTDITKFSNSEGTVTPHHLHYTT